MIQDRIRQFIEYKGISIREFERVCGLGNAFVRNIKKTISVDKVERILQAYPEINRDWLLAGKGGMLSPPASPPPNLVVDTRPRLPINSTAGQNEALDGVALAQCEQVPVVTMFPDYTFTMRVTGESMQPYINPGDEVACLKIEEPSFLQWGRIYVLFTSQGVIVKKIFDAGDGIRCVSFNENYPDFIIPKSEIYSFNLVIGLVRLCN